MRPLPEQLKAVACEAAERAVPLPAIVRRTIERAYSYRLDRRRGFGRRDLGACGADQTDPYLYGLTSFSAANYYATQSGGGEAGTSTGFGVFGLVRIDSLTTAIQGLLSRQGAPNNGYDLYIDASQQLTAVVYNGTSAFTTPVRKLTASDVGRIFLVGVQHTPGSVRLWCDRAPSAATAVTGSYAAMAAAMALGTINSATTNAATGCTILSGFTFWGTPTDAQIQAVYDYVRSAGDVPTSMSGATIVHRWSARDVLRGKGAVTGNAAPSSLPDSTTQANGDAFTAVGASKVARIDPSTDGRTSYGVQGFNSGNYLQTAAGAGLQGSVSGFHGFAVVRVDAVPTTEQFIAHNLNAGATTGGWDVSVTSGAVLRFVVVNSTGGVGTSGTYNIVPSDVGQTLLIGWVWTGTVAQLVVRRTTYSVTVGSGYGITPSPAQPMQVGNWVAQSRPTTSLSIFALQGGNYVPTSGEVLAQFDTFDATGAIASLGAGKTDHQYVVSQDVIASGDLTRVPAVIKDRVGTDDLTRIGIDVHTDANAIRGVGPFDAATSFQTAPGGGVQGNASGFAVVVDDWLTKVPTAVEAIAHCLNAAGTGGWFLQVGATGLLTFNVMTSSITTTSASYQLTSSDLGKRLRIVGHFTGSQLRLYVNSATQVGSDVAATFTPPGSLAMVVGNYNGTRPHLSGYVELFEGGGTLSSGDLTSLFSSLTTAAPSVTNTSKRYVFESDIAAANGKLTGRFVERIGGGDDLVRVGSGLTLATRCERLFAYETSPIYRDGSGFTVNDNYSVAGGWDWTAAGGGFAIPITVLSQSVASATRVIVSKRDATTPGYQLTISGTNQLLSFTVGSSSNSTTTTSATINATDVGKRLIVICWFDGSKAHLYIKRAEVGSGSSALSGTYANSTAPFLIGKRGDNTLPADNIAIGGFVGIVGIPSAAECNALHDAILARESVQSIPSREGVLYDTTLDAAGSSTPVVSIRERIAGTQNLSANGSPTQTQQYARAAA